jgi:hypothetical protein
MLNTFNERYLPRYEDLVKRYYEALAEKNEQRDARRNSGRRSSP